MVEVILKEYKELIEKSEWMDAKTKENALNTTSNMQRFIGYHENLRLSEANSYYNDLERWPPGNLFELTLSFVILNRSRISSIALKKEREKSRLD